MSESKSIKRNYLYNLFYQLLTYMVPLITTPYLSRVLGPDGIGTVSFSESIVTYFVLVCNLGISAYGQREISFVQNDVRARSIVFWEAKALNLVTCIITLGAYGLYIVCADNKAIYLVLALNIIATGADITWFFRGLEEFGKVVLRNTIIKVLWVVFIFAFIKSKQDLLLYAFGIAFFLFLGNIVMWFNLPKYIVKVSLDEIKPIKVLPVAISLFIPELAVAIYTVLDKTMIGVISRDFYENGYYEQAMKLTKMIMAMVTSLGTVMAPRIGASFGKGDNTAVRELVYKNYCFVWALGVPLSFGLFYVAPFFVPWFFGASFTETATLLKILACLILVIGISNVTGMQYLVPTKRQNLLTLTVLVGAIANFVMNLFFIRMMNSKGAAIASVISEVIVLATQFVLIHHEISCMRVLLEGLPFLASGIVMLLVLTLIGSNLDCGIVSTIILVVAGAATYSFAVFFCHKIGVVKYEP